jgi:DNA repair exonuclease SbcCD nuclease subunit
VSTTEYRGLAFIGDPHLSSRVPGFRRDDYPRTALAKLKFCLKRSRKDQLLPVLLGDVFDRPRDNANWLVGELLDLLSRYEVLTIYGNHDCRENSLTDDDTFSILLKSGHVRLLSPESPWRGRIAGRSVILGGSPWGQPVPESFSTEDSPADSADKNSLVVWVTHHDLQTSAEMRTGIKPDERPGIEIVVNGHLHTRQDPIVTGKTTWLVPGSLTRLGRSETSRTQPPSFLKIGIEPGDWQSEYIEIPHEPFDDVFFEAAQLPESADLESSFVQGLAELQAHRTESGAGLVFFLEQNLPAFDEPIAQEVLSLAELVTGQPIHADFSQARFEAKAAVEAVSKSEEIDSRSASAQVPMPTPADEPAATPGQQQTLF